MLYMYGIYVYMFYIYVCVIYIYIYVSTSLSVSLFSINELKYAKITFSVVVIVGFSLLESSLRHASNIAHSLELCDADMSCALFACLSSAPPSHCLGGRSDQQVFEI